MPIDIVYNTGETDLELKNKYNYDGSELRKAQLRMIKMLSFLNDICKENGITYFVAFGTLLGAVRHGGFIPWDDDLDIYINDKDLKKLRKIINNGSYPYVIQDYSSDKGFVRYYNVLRDLKSEYIKEEYQHNQREYRGIQIDLFPYDYGVMEWGVRLVGKTYGLNEKLFLGKNRVLTALIFHLTRGGIIPFLKLISKFKGRKKVGLGYETGDSGYYYYTNDVFPLKTINFEGLAVPCPNHPEAVLKIDYGCNYMELPPENQRNHHKVIKYIYYREAL